VHHNTPPATAAPQPTAPRAAFTDDEVVTALNEAANDTVDTGDTGDTGDEGLRDALNLMVNATIAYLRGDARDLREVVEHSYGEDYQTVLGWVEQVAR
jgi:hypothetical protein